MNYYTRYDLNNPESQAKARADVDKMLTPYRPKMPDPSKIPNPVVAYYKWGFGMMLRVLDRYHPDEAQKIRSVVEQYRSSLVERASVQSNTAGGGV